MKGNVIKIYDTRTGNLIVPYYLKQNLVFLASNSDGHLAFLDQAGKLSLIDVFAKKLVLESADSILALLAHLKA